MNEADSNKTVEPGIRCWVRRHELQIAARGRIVMVLCQIHSNGEEVRFLLFKEESQLPGCAFRVYDESLVTHDRLGLDNRDPIVSFEEGMSHVKPAWAQLQLRAIFAEHLNQAEA